MSVLAFDLGASSGRAMLGRLNGRTMEVKEIHRFPNDPVRVGARLHWDMLRLYHEMKEGLLRAKGEFELPKSIGIDSWAVDFGLLDAQGELLANPYHYRDESTEGVMEQVFRDIPPAEIFSRTGIQFLPFNTAYQLVSIRKLRPHLLREASSFLMIPDLLRYFLTGDMASEFTNASTTQLYNPVKGDWDWELISKLSLPPAMFHPALQPGTEAGRLRPSVTAELGVPSIPVIAVAEHDTGSAVAAVPALSRSFAYLSCGTWSLMGTEVQAPVLTERARELNFTNEGGAYGTYRLLKNIMGLWILQECKRSWEREGILYSYAELVMMAEAEPPFSCFIDPDDPVFMSAGDMPKRIREYAARTGQNPPDRPGVVVRCILESLAFRYREVLELTESLTGHSYNGLHMVGGGIHNAALCQWTANAILRPVWAGPAEGSAIGNMAVQWIALGELSDIWEARAVIRESFPVQVYEPEDNAHWAEAYGKYKERTGGKGKPIL